MAPKLPRYHDLSTHNINVDFQVHTTWTDGKASIEELLLQAVSRNLSAIAFTEHVRRDTAWFSDFAYSVRKAAKGFSQLEVYIGCEAKTLNADGDLDVSQAIHDHCDLVLGSVHRFPDGHGNYLDWDVLSDPDFAQMEFELAMGLIEHAPINVLAHPGGMYERQRKHPFPQEYYRQLMAASLKTGVAIEINSSYMIDPKGFLSLCDQLNPIVSIGSDVHNLNELAHCRDMLLRNNGWER